MKEKEKSKKSAKTEKMPKNAKNKKNNGNNQTKQKITENMLIGELVQKYPEAAMVLMNEGIHCVGCGGAAFETIEQGLMLHGKTKKEIENIIKKINNSLDN